MTPTQVGVVTAALIKHTRLRPPAGDCSCGHVVPLGGLFAEHQAREVLAALEREDPQ